MFRKPIVDYRIAELRAELKVIRFPLLLVSILSLVGAASASAQLQVAIANASEGGHVIGVDPYAREVVWAVETGRMITPAVVISPDGRFTSWVREEPLRIGLSNYFLVLRDAMNGTVFSRLLPRRSSPQKWLFHPRRSSVFVLHAGLIDRFDGAQIQLVGTCFGPDDMRLTADGRQLFVLCNDRVQIIDTETLALTRELARSDASPSHFEVNADGSRFAILRVDAAAASTPSFALFDAVSGARLAAANVPVGPALLLQAPGDRSKLFASFEQSSSRGVTLVLDFSTLAQVGQFPSAVRSLAASADGTLLVAVARFFSSRGTALVIEARLTPTGPIVATISIDEPSFKAFVPAGTYYVTVRAVNFLGSSPPSTQQQVVVP